jgi:hypothetical protein
LSKGKKNIVKKETRYNKVLKQFTAINNKLPEEAKISLRQRRSIIKQFILPKFDKVPDYKLRVRDLKASILYEYDKLPNKPPEACNLNFIDPSNYKRPINFYEIDEFFEKIMPDCIYAKVSAGEFGDTNIFNTRDYSYGRKGIQAITESIRKKYSKSGVAFYVGFQKLRPNKKNNGESDSYYLDMVLYINNTPQGTTNTTKFKLPKSRLITSTKNKVQNLLDAKFKILKNEKVKKSNARKSINKTNEKIKEAKKKLKRNPNSEKANVDILRARTEYLTKYEKMYEKGIFTKEQLNNIINRMQ